MPQRWRTHLKATQSFGRTVFYANGPSPRILLQFPMLSLFCRSRRVQLLKNLIVLIQGAEVEFKFESCSANQTHQCREGGLPQVSFVGRDHRCGHTRNVSQFALTETALKSCQLQKSCGCRWRLIQLCHSTTVSVFCFDQCLGRVKITTADGDVPTWFRARINTRYELPGVSAPN